MTKIDKTTEELILNAARKIFTTKGFAAARMDDIAKEAGINRALLHYYFRSKDKMFDIIFEEKFREFFMGVGLILGSDMPLFEKIPAIIEHELTTLAKHPDVPMFVIGEISQNPEKFLQRIQGVGVNPKSISHILDKQIQSEYKKGIIKKIDGPSLLINIMSLAIYPFIAKNLWQVVFEMDEHDYLKFIEKRKKELSAFIIDGIRA